jgi:hypothetical protein
MSEPTPKTFAEHLVAQDPPISEEKYREHRMQLEKALSDSARREFRVRMTVLVLWTLCWISLSATSGVGIGWHAQLPRWHHVLQYLLLIVTLVETVSYFVRFLPARLRAGSALNRNILLDLDRRITDLTNRIDRTTSENRPEQTQS